MFQRTVEGPAPVLRVTVDGREMPTRKGESVAAALLAAGIAVFRRSAISNAPRGPFCLMGACFECLVTIDGVRQRACVVPAEDGMRIVTGEGRRRLLR